MDTPDPGRSLEEPHPGRLPPNHPRRGAILAAHADAVGRGDPAYLDPESGLYVFTAKFLADRGTCCDTGCRHCPYVR